MATLNDLELELWLRKRDRGLITWTTREGKVIPIKDMSDKHLVNTVNMLNRQDSEMDHLEDCFSIC